MTQAVSPLPQGMRKYVVARAADVPEGGKLIVEVDGREVCVYRIGGRFYAMLNRCPHLGGPLCRGQVVTEVFAPVPGHVRGNADKVFLTCPWHNWEFDIKTGQSYWNPKGLRARPFPVGVEVGEALTRAIESGTAERVKGPYAAETVPVGIEDDYLVLALRPAQQQTKVPAIPDAAAAPSAASPHAAPAPGTTTGEATQ